MDLEQAKQDLKEMLSEKRYLHSLGTMKMAKKLANIYGEDEEKAEFAGLIHDIAKELKEEEIKKVIHNNNIQIDEIEKQQTGLLHAKLRSMHCKRKI